MNEWKSPSRPIISVAIEAAMPGNSNALRKALHGMVTRDPTMRVNDGPVGGQVIVSGVSESHLQSICFEVLEELCDPLDLGEPTAILLETIRGSTEAEGKYIRQTGGSGNYGHVKIRLDPIAADGAFEFLNEVKDGAIPAEYIEPIVQGIRQSMLGGILFGCEVVNVRVTLFGGSYHEIDSNPTAFQIAASLAFKEAAHKSSPILLEPIMAVDIAISEAQLSAQVRDISSRRGRVESIELRPEFLAITAHIPLRETLHTSPNGRLKHPMRFLRYEELPSRFDDLGDDGLGVGVRNPKHPSTGQGSSAANPDPGRML